MLVTFRTEEALDCIQENRETKGKQEDSVVKRAEQLGSLPAVRQSRLPFCLGGQLIFFLNVTKNSSMVSYLGYEMTEK